MLCLMLNADRLEENYILCFKLIKPCETGYSILNQEMKLLINKSIHTNPFIATNSYMEDVNEEKNIMLLVMMIMMTRIWTLFNIDI